MEKQDKHLPKVLYKQVYPLLGAEAKYEFDAACNLIPFMTRKRHGGPVSVRTSYIQGKGGAAQTRGGGLGATCECEGDAFTARIGIY